MPRQIEKNIELPKMGYSTTKLQVAIEHLRSVEKKSIQKNETIITTTKSPTTTIAAVIIN
jgi:hypothetical protein